MASCVDDAGWTFSSKGNEKYLDALKRAYAKCCELDGIPVGFDSVMCECNENP
jgi:hypothetical protein